MYWLFHWYKNKQKLMRDGTRKTKVWKIFFLYLYKRTVVTISCGSTLPVFAFVSAKIPSSFLRDLAFLTRYLETSNSFVVFSIENQEIKEDDLCQRWKLASFVLLWLGKNVQNFNSFWNCQHGHLSLQNLHKNDIFGPRTHFGLHLLNYSRSDPCETGFGLDISW